MNEQKSSEKQPNRSEDDRAEDAPADVGEGSPVREADPDDALKSAIKAALDAGLFDRARALLDVLSKTSAAAEVVDLRERRREK